jgi:hypothetical protein
MPRRLASSATSDERAHVDEDAAEVPPVFGLPKEGQLQLLFADQAA